MFFFIEKSGTVLKKTFIHLALLLFLTFVCLILLRYCLHLMSLSTNFNLGNVELCWTSAPPPPCTPAPCLLCTQPPRPLSTTSPRTCRLQYTQEGKGYWIVNYTVTQSFISTKSYSFAQNLILILLYLILIGWFQTYSVQSFEPI